MNLTKKMKPGISLNEAKNLVKEVFNTKGYALCVGAGISMPLFPTWDKLCLELIEKYCDKNLSNLVLLNLSKQYSLDAVIQAIKNSSGLEDDEFSEILSNSLYSSIANKLSESDYEIFASVMSHPNPGAISNKNWQDFEKIINAHFLKTSAFSLGQFIYSSYTSNIPPDAVMTFNAEPLLFQLINMFSWIGNNRQVEKFKKTTDPLTRSISSQNKGRIPYYFCHGLTKIPKSKINKNEFSSNEKLVFSESDYLMLASSSYSWQSNVFMDICSNKRIFFIGLSLSDPNIRKWLSWSIFNRKSEISSLNNSTKESTLHFWINEKPKEKQLQEWYEAIVEHLGVRIIWLDSWADLRLLLSSML